MNYKIDSIILRKPEAKDIEALYIQKNDPEVAALLGGFSTGYSHTDLNEWIEYHREKKNEVVWVIAATESDQCIGHVGLYQIDHRCSASEFAIMIGDKSAWRKGLGKKITRFVIDYGFSMLNLNRIQITVLKNNSRALNLYLSVGFREEGIMRQAQFKNGKYIDLVIMSILNEEYDPASR